jgi:hypothetical protein
MTANNVTWQKAGPRQVTLRNVALWKRGKESAASSLAER